MGIALYERITGIGKMSDVIFMLPCAGGCSISYAEWMADLQARAVPIEYPGHWLRRREALPESVGELTEDICRIIRSELKEGEHFSVFGHSMGGYLAWLAALKLNREGKKAENLYIASTPAPDREAQRKLLRSYTEGGAENFIRTVGQDKLMAEGDSANYRRLLQFIDHDLTILGNYIFTEEKQRLPIHCIIGDRDPLCGTDWYLGWEKQAQEPMEHHILKGDHFFLNVPDNRKTMIDYINQNG